MLDRIDSSQRRGSLSIWETHGVASGKEIPPCKLEKQPIYCLSFSSVSILGLLSPQILHPLPPLSSSADHSLSCFTEEVKSVRRKLPHLLSITCAHRLASGPPAQLSHKLSQILLFKANATAGINGRLGGTFWKTFKIGQSYILIILD